MYEILITLQSYRPHKEKNFSVIHDKINMENIKLIVL
jgi:hypothetical protein